MHLSIITFSLVSGGPPILSSIYNNFIASAKIFLILNNKLLIVSYESVFLYFINIDYNKIIDNKADNSRWDFRMKRKKENFLRLFFLTFFIAAGDNVRI